MSRFIRRLGCAGAIATVVGVGPLLNGSPASAAVATHAAQLRISRGFAPRTPFTPRAGVEEFQGLGPSETYTSGGSSETEFWTPGEPVVAVGPTEVVETANEAAAVYSKTGTKLREFDFGTFWGGTFSNLSACTDPRALYIASADRFAISCSDNGPAPDPLRFAISKTNDPATGGWYLYAAPNTSFLDQDKIEATSDKFVIAGNTSTNEQIDVYNLADVTTGVAHPPVVHVVAKKSNLYQAVVQETATSAAYFVASFPGNLLYLATISGTPAAANVALTEIKISSTDYAAPVTPTVPGGSYDPGDGRVLDAVYEVETSDSKPVIQYSSTRDCAGRNCLTSARIDLSGTKPVLKYDQLAGEPGFDYTYGAVGLDATGNVFEAYSRSDSTDTPSAAVIGPGFDVALQPATSGSSACSSGTCQERWGDYLGTAIDPSDPSSVWVTGLYQSGAGGFAWGTVIARVSVGAFSLPTATTGSAKVTGTTAKLLATVNPNGAATTYHFDWGLNSGYSAATAPANAGSGTSAVAVNATLTGLTPGTTYHYRIVATTSAGNAIGLDRSFKVPGPVITSVSFTGSPSNPTVTINGSNFGTEPSGYAAGCGSTGDNFNNALWFTETTQSWTAGQGGDCIGLLVSSYTASQIVYQFGSGYSNYGQVTGGDAYTVDVGTKTFSGTVAFS